MELNAKIINLREQLSTIRGMQQDKDLFTEAVRKFMQMETLTSPLLHELIDHIEVHETEGTGKNRTQKIVIYYRYRLY